MYLRRVDGATEPCFQHLATLAEDFGMDILNEVWHQPAFQPAPVERVVTIAHARRLRTSADDGGRIFSVEKNTYFDRVSLVEPGLDDELDFISELARVLSILPKQKLFSLWSPVGATTQKIQAIVTFFDRRERRVVFRGQKIGGCIYFSHCEMECHLSA